MEIECNINGQDFTIGEIPCGEYKGKFCWSTSADEGQPCDTAVEAQADAMQHVRQAAGENAA